MPCAFSLFGQRCADGCAVIVNIAKYICEQNGLHLPAQGDDELQRVPGTDFRNTYLDLLADVGELRWTGM
jgi:hypothetical protein